MTQSFTLNLAREMGATGIIWYYAPFYSDKSFEKRFQNMGVGRYSDGCAAEFALVEGRYSVVNCKNDKS